MVGKEEDKALLIKVFIAPLEECCCLPYLPIVSEPGRFTLSVPLGVPLCKAREKSF